MKYRKSLRIHFFLVTVLFLFFVAPIQGQDSVFYMWNDLVRNPEMNEVDLLLLAQQANIELKILEHSAKVCQQFQPEKKEAAEKLKSHIFEIGKNVREFLGRYSEEKIEELGAKINNTIQESYETQKKEMPKYFREMEDDDQKNICSELRTEILNMTPAVKVERFKK